MARLSLIPIVLTLSASARADTRLESTSTEPESSVSCGWPNRGALAHAAELPLDGIGFRVPGPWRARGLHFGTEELVGLVERAASTVAAEHPGAVLGVADLSRRDGGAVPRHLSHQSGRDADLIYYALDDEGEPMDPDGYMAYYKASGRATYAHSPDWERHIPPRSFDVERNWALVKALLTDPQVEVIRIFVSNRVKHWLLRYARQRGEPEDLVHRARKILLRPSKVGGHNDHMHVRIECSARDEILGRCRRRSTRSPRHGHKWRGGMTCPRPE